MERPCGATNKKGSIIIIFRFRAWPTTDNVKPSNWNGCNLKAFTNVQAETCRQIFWFCSKRLICVYILCIESASASFVSTLFKCMRCPKRV